MWGISGWDPSPWRGMVYSPGLSAMVPRSAVYEMVHGPAAPETLFLDALSALAKGTATASEAAQAQANPSEDVERDLLTTSCPRCGEPLEVETAYLERDGLFELVQAFRGRCTCFRVKKKPQLRLIRGGLSVHAPEEE